MKKTQFVATIIAISSIFICAIAWADEPPQERVERFRSGFGLGVPYGVIGANLSFQINDLLEVNAGLGTPGEGFLGWAIGGRIYPFPKLKRFRPRLSALYGVVGVVTNNSNDDILDVYEGPAFGVGFIWKFFRRHSIDIDIFYTTEEPPERVNGFKTGEKNEYFFALGYGFHF